jgi:hypothetical protein
MVIVGFFTILKLYGIPIQIGGEADKHPTGS